MNKSQLAVWFSERTGGDWTPPNDMRVRNGWLFVLDRFTIRQYGKDCSDGVDCYPLENAICLEAWDCISYNESPFTVKTFAETAELTNRLQSAWDSYCAQYH